MATFILVHGSWHGPWCWDGVRAGLEGAGHKAVAVDLRGDTPLAEQNLDTYTAQVVAALDAEGSPCVLVGHSAGGAFISQAAEARPELVSRLVYVAGFLLSSGQTILDVATTDEGNNAVPNLVFSEDGVYSTLKGDAAVPVLFADCDPAAAEAARARLEPEANAPLASALSLTEARYGSVPRTYIECLQDKAISIAAQRAMVAAQPCADLITMNTSHSPFMADTPGFVGHLLAQA